MTGSGRLAVLMCLVSGVLLAEPPKPSTFSIAAADPAAGEVGVAVASRFFAVGAVVPYVRAGVGAVATQASANTGYGARGLDLLARGLTPKEALAVLLRGDDGRDRRQVGLVTASGDAVSYTGSGCNAWAGGRSGPGYAIQGNILVGEAVVRAVEREFLATAGKPLAERLYLALKAGDAEGGDSRGRQSAAVVVCRPGGGYSGFTDNAIDVRVDDHPDPFAEIGRLVGMALVNDLWNRGWRAFEEKRFPEALVSQEKAATQAESQSGMLPEVLYDLAVVRLANGDHAGALAAARRAIALNPKLAIQAARDGDLAALRAELAPRP
ncbi:MAG TPA: DUF1028 domain-containing protein [Thermoanaerobaculaceae bacterium]|nr:DUF1028 domain-containing protein [Thermoanaerobaculaceae bacterium]